MSAKYIRQVQVIFLLVSLILLIFPACEKLDLRRVMDASTDSVPINGTSVVVYGTVLDTGEGAIPNHGHCWATHGKPEITDFHTELGPIEGTVEFYSSLNSVMPGVVHYVRSYLYDGKNYFYGDVDTFNISADNIDFKLNEIVKIDPGTIEVNSATNGLGSVNFTNHGHCWSQTNPPTIENSKTSFGNYLSDALYTSRLHNLTMGRYFIRGYLESDGVVVYTNTITYESEISVETGIISLNIDNSVVANGNIVSLGINPIIDYGHCYSETTSKPDFNSDRTSFGALNYPISYSSSLTGLNSGKTYYIRAYATDGSKVYYGNVTSFVPN